MVNLLFVGLPLRFLIIFSLSDMRYWLSYFLFILLTCNVVLGQSKFSAFKIVILGSSTSEGIGASSPNSSWVGLYTTMLTKLNSKYKIVNLAKAGYSTWHLCPTGYHAPNQIVYPDVERNITKALSLNPDAIIINLPANDLVYKVPLDIQKKNFDLIVETALRDSVPVWITTTQPRNGLSEVDLKYQLEMRDWIQSHYGNRAIDLWSGLATSEGALKSQYAYVDGVHLNDNGHALVFKIINQKNIPKALEDAVVMINSINPVPLIQGWEFDWVTTYEKGIDRFVLEREDSDSTWEKINSVRPPSSSESNTNRFYSLADTAVFPSEKRYRISIVNKKSRGSIYTYSQMFVVNGAASKCIISPNPSYDYFLIKGLPGASHVVEVFNVLAQPIFMSKKYKSGDTVYIKNWTSGIYYIKIDGHKTNLKLVKL